MITSRQNSHLKLIRRLRRVRGDEAIIEGPHLVSEALAAGLELSSILATSEFLASETGRDLSSRLPRPPLEVDARCLDEVADSDSPRGLIAVASMPRRVIEALPVIANGLYLFLEGIQDPGNLGALARVAEAAGATGLALSAGSVHPHHPRALRASAGSLLRLPLAFPAAPADLDHRLSNARPRWLALEPRGGRHLYHTPLEGALILALGAEGPGLSATVSRHADMALTIPIASPVESLNVTTAAAVVLFELRRRRLEPRRPETLDGP